jgi:hypothetical protein
VRVLAIERDGPCAERRQGAPIRPDAVLLALEARRVWELQQADVLREIHFRADRAAAVLVLECADLGAARAAVESLPLVAAGMIAFELIPLVPYPGYARLFAAGAETRTTGIERRAGT